MDILAEHLNIAGVEVLPTMDPQRERSVFT